MASARAKVTLAAVIPLVLLGGIFVAAMSRPDDDPGSVVDVSGPMPELQGEWLNGERPEGLRETVVLVNFWADWCVPCRKEQPVLQRLSDEYDGRVRFIGVNYRDDRAKALEFIREFGVTYPSVVDDGPLGHAFGVPYLPATILVDRGEMRYLLLGAQEEPQLREYLDELLAS